MKSTIIKSLFVAAVAVIVPLTSQYVEAQDGKGLVAVLDVAKVFKENQEFTSKMDAIKQEADALKIQITKEQDVIKSRAEGLSTMAAGSTERNKLEGDLTTQQALLQTKARQAEAELLNREARIYYDTYIKMQGVVESLASQHGISLVLRFDSEPIDSNNRAEVIKGVNRAVVYHRRIDLTNMVGTAMGPRVAAADRGTQNK